MREKVNYTIGLDIGTASVGWAVIDDDFNLLQGKKRIREGDKLSRKRTNLWGSRLFTNANPAADRRLKRGMRRRLERRAKRLRYLRNIFAEEIAKIDDSFFIRLEESFRQDETKPDRKNGKGDPKWQYPLFNNKIGAGETFANEADYHKKYPTIYHLRERLVDDKSQADIRLIYLALSHITKFRGHFVQEDTEFNFDNINIRDSVKNLIDLWNATFTENGWQVRENCEGQIESELKNKKHSPSWKRAEIEKILELNSRSEFSEMLKLAVGNLANFKKVFGLEEDLKIAATADDFDDKIAILTDEQQDLVRVAQKVNNDILLDESLLDGSLSKRMIEKYETHQKQLHELKKFAKEHDIFREIFGSEKDKTTFGIYTKYIQGVGNPAKTYGTDVDGFYKDLRKIISDKVGEDDEFFKKISAEMDLGNYLPKQRVYINGAIPFQVHRDEMQKIIANQSRYYPNIEWNKIVPLMSFRIPYYVGTLAKNPGWVQKNGSLIKNENSFAKNAWVVRKNDKNVTPWNFDEVVDKDASAVNFIERMTNFDTYLPDEKVLPAKSLTYQKYAVLNELTKVKIGGDFLAPDQKKKVFSELFAGKGKTGKVSAKDFAKFMMAEFSDSGIREDNISGIDGRGFNASYTTFHDFERAGIDFARLSDENNLAKFDDIAKMQTIFEDKKILAKQLHQKYADFLTDDEIARISKKHYTGWGRLSRKLLTGIFDGDGRNIMWYLENDKAHRNFQQLITDDNLPFAKVIKEANLHEDDGKLTYDAVESLAGSPAIKRGIWQSIKVVDELVKFMGYKPSRVAIEFARENQNSHQTDSRKRSTSQIVDKLKEEFGKDALDKSLVDQFDNKDFSQRLQLYFMQNGKDMYDGSPINIERLSEYDIDHIYPQSLTKDDSIDNKVLVSRENNRKKSDDPAGAHFGDMIPFWRRLAKAGAISQIKLARLQKTKFTDADLRGFINRQIVETRQIMKNVALILGEKLGEDTKILTPKARFAHELRETNGWAKNREINDFHHAHDAYLNAIVGVFRDRMGFEDFAKKLRQNYAGHSADELKRQANLQATAMDIWRYEKRELSETYTDKITNETKHLYEKVKIADDKTWTDTTTGEIWWSKDVLARIGKAFNYRDVNVVRKTEDQVGKFGDESVYKKDNSAIPSKNYLDTARYGGAKAPISAFSVVVLDGKNEIKAVSVPSMLGQQFRKSSDKLNLLRSMYPKDNLQKILIDEVDKYTKYVAKNGAMRLVASYQEAQNGIELPIMDIPTEKSDDSKFENTFDVLSSFIIKNKLFLGDKTDTFGEIRTSFMVANNKDRLQIIGEMLRVAQGSNQGLKALQQAGLGTTAQQLKDKDDLIGNDSVVIYQSPTGLYESQVRLRDIC